MKKYWHKLSFLQKNVLLTVLVILTLVGTMGALSFNMFQNSMMSIFERHSFETGDTVLHKLDEEIVRDVTKDPVAQREKREKLTEKLDEATEELNSVGQTYIVGAKKNEKGELLIVDLSTDLANVVEVRPGEYYKQPDLWMEAYDKVMSTKKANMTVVYEDLLGTWVTILEPIKDGEGNIVAIVAADVDASIVPSTKEKFIIQGLMFICISVLIATVIQFLIVRNALAPLRDLREGLRRVGEGDLNIKLEERSDDIGIINSYFNNTIEKFKGIIDKVKQTAEQVSSSSQELSVSTKENSMAVQEIVSSMVELRAGAQLQETSVPQYLGIVYEVEDKMEEITNAAKQMEKVSEGIEHHSVKGNGVTKQAINQMNIIQNAVQDLSSIIYSLEVRSKEISDIVTVITSISNQTNSLALHATIEASRAEETGEGFAVVADEVRKLAEQMEASAKDIANLIGETQAGTEEAVVSIRKASKEVESGMKLVEMNGAFFEEISKSAQSVTNQVRVVSSNSSDILQNSQNIVRVVNELSLIANTYTNSSSNVEESMKEQEMSVQDIAELASSLSWLSQELQELIGEFKS
ncbi:TPA: HAMP domain-containing protein [Bacillus cereus]|uniref:Probable methyl-accepting chemotaxis protein BT9727_0355 n=6 Tax=Bacillus cereus group TaxID=86661 RepID=Y355_BACHK|nr:MULTISPECIES: methyl-accepting chemotaxis protein [Bacillus]Q6HP15.1 RecName: Full=Probable methyl-accepting chemotaxis protein BT9727_0355 [[Bacillus thuringiensis] serovar konkukian str. 97-27]MDR4321421.1 HAMP domain-containing protein [Bacillus paranthracis]COF01227.1 H1 [Streptococcus pneumoniae]HDR4491851.1 HAMP domain-containing protein [Bacillus cereus biovar anthracis]AAT61241.1 methyl-accepting chemotaxis protein [[Bacillus thuringiensis] serovar konkukian str. 97-27]ACO27236.1 m